MIDYSSRNGDWIITYTGKRFYPLDPRSADFDIRDIAHALSLINRFTGHTRYPYSVAQHCIAVSYLLDDDPQLALSGLLHDASEAYVNDLSRPLKQYCDEYRRIEEGIFIEIDNKWQVDTRHEAVKQADAVALVTEAKTLCNGETWYLESHWPAAADYAVQYEDWQVVEKAYQERFGELMWREWNG